MNEPSGSPFARTRQTTLYALNGNSTGEILSRPSGFLEHMTKKMTGNREMTPKGHLRIDLSPIWPIK